MEETEKFEQERDRLRQRINRYTGRAYRVIPPFNDPRILDVGCGSGVPTMTLAELCGGRITAIDTDQSALDRLSAKVKKDGLEYRIMVLNQSMLEMDFPNDSFDIIWAEGSISVIGFQNGIRAWSRFLSPGGCMAIHDDKGDVPVKIQQIRDCGYRLLDRFIIDTDAWMEEYYIPLEKLVGEAMKKDIADVRLRRRLEEQQAEIGMVKKDPAACSSVFFIFQK